MNEKFSGGKSKDATPILFKCSQLIIIYKTIKPAHWIQYTLSNPT